MPKLLVAIFSLFFATPNKLLVEPVKNLPDVQQKTTGCNKSLSELATKTYNECQLFSDISGEDIDNILPNEKQAKTTIAYYTIQILDKIDIDELNEIQANYLKDFLIKTSSFLESGSVNLTRSENSVMLGYEMLCRKLNDLRAYPEAKNPEKWQNKVRSSRTAEAQLTPQ